MTEEPERRAGGRDNLRYLQKRGGCPTHSRLFANEWVLARPTIFAVESALPAWRRLLAGDPMKSNAIRSVLATGADPISLTFIFSAHGFEDTMRCNSVPAGETPTPITPEQRAECAHAGHAEYEDIPAQLKAK